MSLVIKHGTVVNDDRMFPADVLIQGEIIRDVGQDLEVPEGAKVIDAAGKYVIPGGVDPHTHFDTRFMGAYTADDFCTGTRAALAGGTTTIMNFVMESEASLLEDYDKARGKADSRVCCDYGLHMIVKKFDDQIKKDMEVLVKDKGINSFKMFMAYKESLMLRDDVMLEVMAACKSLGALAQVHAENGDVIAKNQKELLAKGVTGPEGHLYSRPEEVEAEATLRASVLASQASCPLYVVHVMSRSAANVISSLRRENSCIIFGETLAGAVAKDGLVHFDKCWHHAAGNLLSPPLRPDPATPEVLLQLLANNDLQVTATDHCTFSKKQKELGRRDFTKIPNGINGVEERMSVVWDKGVESGLMDPCRFVAVTSTNASKIFNLYPQKGRIQAGSDADMVVWDPKGTRVFSAANHHSAVDFNVFEGMECRGVPVVVISRGRVVLNDGKLMVSPGSGRFLPTPPFAPEVYNRVFARDKVAKHKKVVRDGD